MRRSAFPCILGLAVFVAAPSPACTQLALGAQAGTVGLGGTLAFGLNPSLVFRGSANVFPLEPEVELDDISYTTEFPTPQFLITADFHPGGGSFYLSGGLHLTSDDFTVTAEPTEDVELGDRTYTPEDIGSLVGSGEGNQVSPYLGIGLGNPVGADRQIGLHLDLGVSFIGDPEITLDHEGGSLSQQEEDILRENLRQEAANAEEDAPGVYPVVNIGLSFKVGGR